MEIVDAVADALNFRALLEGRASIPFRECTGATREHWRDLARLILYGILAAGTLP